MHWPTDPLTLAAEQERLAGLAPPPWEPLAGHSVGASYVCFARGSGSPGLAGEPGWAAAARKSPGERSTVVVVEGPAAAGYAPGRLALREGELRERALQTLPEPPDVLLVDATGRDHPLRAGLALQLGARLGLASVGVTDRPLVATAGEPADARGATAPLLAGGELVGHALRTRPGVRPVFVSAGWRVDPDTAVVVVLAAARRARTPQPLREARRAARQVRDRGGG